MEEEKFLDWYKKPLIEFIKAIQKDNIEKEKIIEGLLTYFAFSKETKNAISQDNLIGTLETIGIINNQQKRIEWVGILQEIQIVQKNDNITIQAEVYPQLFRINPLHEEELKEKYLNEKYLGFLKNKPLPKIKDEERLIQLTEDDLKLNKQKGAPHRLIPQLIEEVNLNYYYGQYNSCALICRRICEILIIEALEIYNKDKDDSDKIIIKKEGFYLGLGSLIKEFKDCTFKGVNKQMRDCLDYAKIFGDIGAHNPFVSVKKQHIEYIKPHIDNIIKILLQLGEFYKLDND